MSKVHILSPTEANLRTQRMLEAGPFTFDLFEATRERLTRESKEPIFDKIGFALDAHIKNAVEIHVRKMYADQRDLPLESRTWANYAEFLDYVSGVALTEQSMHDAGLPVDPMRETLTKLIAARNSVYDTLTDILLPSTFEVPDLRDRIANPGVRRVDAETRAKMQAIHKMDATTESGAIDVDLEKELNEAWTARHRLELADAAVWDKRRGELCVLFLDTLKLDEEHRSEDPFGDLPTLHQFRLMDGTVKRYVPRMQEDRAKDRNVPYKEHVALAMTERTYVKAISSAIVHPLFDELRSA